MAKIPPELKAKLDAVLDEITDACLPLANATKASSQMRANMQNEVNFQTLLKLDQELEYGDRQVTLTNKGNNPS